MQVNWKRGEYISFVANMKIRVGGNNGAQPFEILAGDDFEYDGSVCKYAGAEHQTPQLRGAIRDDWASLKDGDVAEVAPAPAHRPSRAMAKAQTQNRDLSRVQRGAPTAVSWDDTDEDIVLEVDDRRQVMDPRTRVGHLTSAHNRRVAADPNRKPVMAGGRTTLGSATAADFARQDHTEISRITTPATVKVDILKNPGAAHMIESRASAEHGAGRFHGESIHEGISMRTNVRQMNRGGVVDTWDGGDEGEVIGHVRHTDTRQSREGVSVRDTSGPRASGHRAIAQSRTARTAAPSPKKQAAVQAKKSAAKKAAPAPTKVAAKPQKAAPAAKSEPMNPKLRIATSVCPDFPRDWNFFGTTEAKIGRLKELGSDPRMIDALYASDSAAVRSALQKEFPGHFG